ncbi:DUF4214 domain-containing protein [uncultured Marivita sp.]|uniref:DUF4214 domain-containing protein n=1 Tax=uncultured Marivita sp. TaxID=888080 RepID=UPI002603652F|nr:DUF4214 domain-containing protein [uncultured Marivita sp.]
MLDLVNEERTSRGLNALVLDQVLNASADVHSAWMLDNNVFSHTGIGGSTPTQRMEAEGFDLSGSWRTAENIAAQSVRGAEGFFDDVYDLHIALMNSPGHRENILLPDLEVVGIGIQTGSYTYDSGTYFSVMATQNFARTEGRVSPDIAAQATTLESTSPSPNTTSILVGDATVEYLLGTPENDSIVGLGGNDTLMGGAGDDLIDGGLGIDTAAFSGNQGFYTLQLSPGETIVFDRRPSEDGTDTLLNIENLSFENSQLELSKYVGAVELSTEEFAALTELYIAYFDRAPAAKGLFYWATELSNGMSRVEIAKSFFVQPETQKTYEAFLDANGELTDAEGFVTTVYNNVLGRDPNESGKSFWINELEKPDAHITPAIFILAVLNGAKATTGSNADAEYLEAKTDIGVYFSAIKGMSNYNDTISVMSLFDGSSASVTNAVNEIDLLHTDALDPNSGEFLIELVGVIDDPFI